MNHSYLLFLLRKVLTGRVQYVFFMFDNMSVIRDVSSGRFRSSPWAAQDTVASFKYYLRITPE
ncbi:MAG: hypothetical protein D3906_05570 [Candidatus Electrothrix sp. AUS1_2]|nr:hypothetical protein [Candidatus Electrothrix sp. AUS1_2]